MKDKTFFAINLDDFHSNQKGEPKTNCEMLFISAKDLESAKKYVACFHPQTPWFVIPKEYCDRNIVYRDTDFCEVMKVWQ